ncbi:MAG: type II toxin-antitoxin system HicB family antitoxin [Ignavibacteriae bacterium]|nr:type II toxin-antitoxin system HicB family antitoxin [Ignavibacteriota bacterium]
MKFTLKIIKGNNDYLVGQIKEIPSVLTQGKTIDEVKENIVDALELYMKDMREEKVSEKEDLILEEELTY